MTLLIMSLLIMTSLIMTLFIMTLLIMTLLVMTFLIIEHRFASSPVIQLTRFLFTVTSKVIYDKNQF
jgi:hypothetical protein